MEITGHTVTPPLGRATRTPVLRQIVSFNTQNLTRSPPIFLPPQFTSRLWVRGPGGNPRRLQVTMYTETQHILKELFCVTSNEAAKENVKGKNGRGRDRQEGELWDTPGRLSVLVQRAGFEALREDWLSDVSAQRDAQPRGLSATALLIGGKIRELWLDAVCADQQNSAFSPRCTSSHCHGDSRRCQKATSPRRAHTRLDPAQWKRSLEAFAGPVHPLCLT